MANTNLTVAEVTAFAERVKAVLSNAEADRRTVAALRSLLGGGKGLPGGSRDLGRRNGVRGASNEKVQGKVLDYIKSQKNGARLGEVVDSLGLNRAVAARVMARLRQGGAVKLVGHKRLARYHAA